MSTTTSTPTTTTTTTTTNTSAASTYTTPNGGGPSKLTGREASAFSPTAPAPAPIPNTAKRTETRRRRSMTTEREYRDRNGNDADSSPQLAPITRTTSGTLSQLRKLHLPSSSSSQAYEHGIPTGTSSGSRRTSLQSNHSHTSLSSLHPEREGTRSSRDKAERMAKFYGGSEGTSQAGEECEQGRYDSPTIMDGFSSFGYSWPILLAILPPLGSVFFGNKEAWSDFLLIILIAFYLYHLIKVPWELYYVSRQRVFAELTEDATDSRRKESSAALRRQELFSLALVIASPIVGGGTLQLAKGSLSGYDKYFSNFNIILFVLAACIRPITHVIALLKRRAVALQETTHFPYTEMDHMRKKLESLETELVALKAIVVDSQQDVPVRDTDDPGIAKLAKAVKRSERRDEYLRGYSEERFAQLESQLMEHEKALKLALRQLSAVAAGPQFDSHNEDGRYYKGKLPATRYPTWYSLVCFAVDVFFLPLKIFGLGLSFFAYLLPRSLRRGSSQVISMSPASSGKAEEGVGRISPTRLDALGRRSR